MTGTVTAFWRELRGSGSFMDTDPAKIRGGVNRFLRRHARARRRRAVVRAELWGRSLTGGVAQKWHRGVHACSLSEKIKNSLGKKCPRSRASGWSLLTTLWGFPCCVRFPCVHAVATTPAQRLGVLFALLHTAGSAAGPAHETHWRVSDRWP